MNVLIAILALALLAEETHARIPRAVVAIAHPAPIRVAHDEHPSRTPERAELFLDLRVPPHMSMQGARRAAKSLFLDLKRRFPDYGLEFETYVSVPGASIAPDHALVKAIEMNHERVMGEVPKRDVVLWCSDASVMTRYGIETVNYGPSSGPRDADGEKVKIKTLVDVTKIYALTAAELCRVQ